MQDISSNNKNNKQKNKYFCTTVAISELIHCKVKWVFAMFYDNAS